MPSVRAPSWPGASACYRPHQGVDGALRLAGGRKGLTSNRSWLGLWVAPRHPGTFPVLSSAVCVIRGMELWYACTVDGDFRIVQAVPVRPNRAATGRGLTVRFGRPGGHRRVAPPPAAQRPSLWPSLLSVPSRAAPWRRIVTAPGHWRSFGGRVWSPSTLCGRPSAWRPADPEQPGPPYDPGHP
jgi:hypothetical protein